MPERLTEAEVAAIRERWEHEEAICAEIEAWAIKAGPMGNYARQPRTASHRELGRLLATLEASEARVLALTEAGEALYQCLCDEGWPETYSADAWRALTRGGDDGE